MSPSRRTVWETYAQAWKETSREAKASALRQSVSPECVYTDPLTIAHGHAELIQSMLDFHQKIPGGHFPLTYFLDHHNVSIARWNMVAGDGTVLGDGVSYGQYGEDGKLVTMTGFFELPK
jgi:SnoaL-like domain